MGKKRIEWKVIWLAPYDINLGMFWMNLYNLEINWRRLIITNSVWKIYEDKNRSQNRNLALFVMIKAYFLKNDVCVLILIRNIGSTKQTLHLGSFEQYFYRV